MRRNWGLFLILLTLALVWNEYFQSLRRPAPMGSSTLPSEPADSAPATPPPPRTPRPDAATNPPPVSLHVRNAPLEKVIDALNTSMGTHMPTLAAAPESQPAAPALFTLDVSDKPFWDIFAALNSQHPLAFAPTTDFTLTEAPPPPQGGVRGDPAAPARIDRLATSDHFLLTISISRSGPASDSMARFNLAYALAADPRMHPLEVSPELILGSDSAGNRAALAYSGMAIDTRRMIGLTSAAATAFQAAGAPGTRLSQIRVDARFLLATSLKNFEADNVEQKEGQDLNFAGVTLSIKKFARDGTGAVVEIATRVSDDISRRATIRLTDARGLTRWAGIAGATASLTMADFAPPYRLHIEVPEKTVSADASFAIKDIELPQ